MGMARTVVAGVGMSRFRRPSEGARYDELACEAVTRALAHASLPLSNMQQIYAGWAYGDTTSGQRAIHALGLTGVPFFNVNNACASGSSALFLARQAIQSGVADCVLAFGFEQMPAGPIAVHFTDRPDVWGMHMDVADAVLGHGPGPVAPRVFAAAGREQMARFGILPETYAKVAVKARRHAARNPNAVFREPVTLEQVLGSPMVLDPITKLQCCPPTSGAAAAILCSDDFARRQGLDDRVVIAGMSLVSEDRSTFEGSAIDAVGTAVSRRAAAMAYGQAGIGPEAIDVVELHDCFTINELLSYESLGLVPEGGATAFVEDGGNTYGGQVVVNPSGGLLSKGHPLGATGIAQIAELTWQLRGEAEARQVEAARTALQHNVGLNGAAVVTVLTTN